MKNLTQLCVMTTKTPDADIAAMAESLQADNARLSCLILAETPRLTYTAYGYSPYGGVSVPPGWSDMLDKAHEDQTQRVKEVKAILANTGASGDVRSAVCSVSDVGRALYAPAQVCDVVRITPDVRDNPALFSEIAYGVLFQSPTGLIINSPPKLEVSSVFIAWDGSNAAAASVHAALPFIKQANEVVIGCFDAPMTGDIDPGTEVAGWLSHHGCNVTVSQYPSGGQAVGKCIQSRAQETGADLIVMGAYGHSRLIEAVFGGTTRTLFEQTSIPVHFGN